MEMVAFVIDPEGMLNANQSLYSVPSSIPAKVFQMAVVSVLLQPQPPLLHQPSPDAEIVPAEAEGIKTTAMASASTVNKTPCFKVVVSSFSSSKPSRRPKNEAAVRGTKNETGDSLHGTLG
jgi:hypothetical protein